MAGMAGFEPTNARVKVWCLTAWRHPNVGVPGTDTGALYHSFPRFARAIFTHFQYEKAVVLQDIGALLQAEPQTQKLHQSPK